MPMRRGESPATRPACFRRIITSRIPIKAAQARERTFSGFTPDRIGMRVRQVSMYTIGIDLGGTNIKVGIVDEGHSILAKAEISTNVGRPADCIAGDMTSLAQKLLNERNIGLREVRGVGVGSPGIVDSENGVILYSNNFGWENVPLAEMIHRRIALPLAIANDAQCAAIGEMQAGAGMDCRNLILITLGTGVGGGIVLNRKLFTGANEGGGIIGHMVIIKNGETCTCGRKGCLEAYASATALIREMGRAVEAHPDSMLAAEWRKQGNTADARTVFDCTQAGDPVSQQIVNEYIECLGEGIANLINIFRPDKVLVSGGICNQGRKLMEPLNAYVREHCFAGDQLMIPLVDRAVLGNNAGIIGAASLIESGMDIP
jgi:glucokinase